MIEEDYYTKVEQPGYLKRVLYGDSVAEYSIVLVQKKDQKIFSHMKFHELWDYLLSLNCQVINQNDKEYIYLKDEFKTVSYDKENGTFLIETPEYVVRHYVNEELISLKVDIFRSIDVTKNHSMLEYEDLNITTPEDCKFLASLNQMNYSRSGIYRSSIEYIEPFEVQEKTKIDYSGHVYDLCIPKTQNFFANGILVHNTDSIFYIIPTNNPEEKSPEELWDLAVNASESINDLIIDYNKNTLLPRCNIDPEDNHTFFKTELLMSSLLLLDVKKNYAYKLLVKEGNVLEKPKVSYTGIQVVRSDSAKFTQDLLREMIENIILNETIPNENKKDKVIEVINDYRNKIKEHINNLNLNDIGIPGKWSKDKLIINGMKLYNQIMNEEVFSSGSAGKFIYCKFGKDFGKDINGICIPYSYDKDLLNEKLISNKISIDENKQWDTLLTTTCHRVINLVKKLKKGE